MDINLSGPLPKVQDTQGVQQPRSVQAEATDTTRDIVLEKAVQAASAKEREDSTMQEDPAKVPQMLDTMADLLKSINSRLTIQYREDAGRYQVKVLDTRTSEVLKEIPPEDVLKLAARIRQAVGALLDLKA